MAVEITIELTGAVDCEAVHGPSGATLRTTAPKDNGGDGSSFSPTDLVATAMGTCMLTILSMRAREQGVDITGATARVEKHMSEDGPRRIARLPVTIHVPTAPPADRREALETAMKCCPVCASLGAGVAAPVEIVWG